MPNNGYRPDAIFNETKDYWGITFVELPAEKFDVPVPAIVKFTFQNSHYQDVMQGQSFTIMEGPKQVGEGKIISLTSLCTQIHGKRKKILKCLPII